MGILICPVCGFKIKKVNNSYLCDKHHCFDISAKGYINLLLANKKNSKEPGDNRQMVISRKNFLDKGYYKKLSQSINQVVIEKFKIQNKIAVVDAGCGEGYYSSLLANGLKDNNIDFEFYGFDISKEAINYAAKSSNDITFAVASLFNMPVKDNSTDCILHVFAPYCDDEFTRILKSEGVLISIIPGKRHLYKLKEIIYEKPYENDEKGYEVKNLKLAEKIRVNCKITLNNNEDIKALFTMTPYYWKTQQEGVKRLELVTNLETEVDFLICIYKK